jgi:mRNA interferase MazF
MYNKGDIILTPFPFTDLSGSKVRPAVVIASRKKSVDITVVFITSKSKKGGDFIVPIEPSVHNGLKVSSAVVCDKIATLDGKVILGKIGECSSAHVVAVDAELRTVLGL